MMLNIEEPYPHKTAFLQLAFRPFFAVCIAFSVIAMFIWMMLYLFGWSLPQPQYPAMSWHAHEMIFGYTMGIIGGFLLTAIRNWTNIQTLQNKPLLALLILWLIPRLLPFSSWQYALHLTALFDLAFFLALFFSAITPIVKAKQWVQAGIISKLFLIFLCNLAFYLGLFGIIDDGGRTGLYAGFYIILALILTMIRRLLPFFIEKGIDHPFEAKSYKVLDIGSLVLFVCFAIADIIAPTSAITGALALVQFPLHAIRLKLWYHGDIWKKPLLWVLFIAYAWISLGFLLKAGSVWMGLSPFLAVHGFAYGGIGMLSLGMITRVSLGHTGRNVFSPPAALNLIFILLSIGAFFRILMPIIDMSHYLWWIGIAQTLWMIAFASVLTIYLPMFIKARIDGRPG
jgi:uncharacterized protein involved in response to NO